jgi:hypothetical protein
MYYKQGKSSYMGPSITDSRAKEKALSTMK